MKKISYTNIVEQHKELRLRLMEAIGRVFDHGNFILGEDVLKFEQQFATYCGTKYAVGLNSGADALFLSLKALGIGMGDEVITVPNSFIATTSAITAVGARPIFVDIQEDLNINPHLVEAKITKKTRALLPVHLTGKPADMDPLRDLAKKYTLKIIEDAAQAVGAEYNGQKVGALGDVGCFSLHPLKTLNACGDAGIAVTNDESVYKSLLQFRNIGLKNRDESDFWGFNSRLDSIQAAILNVKFSYLEEWTEARRANARVYSEYLKQIVEVPVERKNEKCVYHTFVIQTDKRDELKHYLEDQGISTKIHYPVPIHLQKAAEALGYQKGDFPVTERASTRILSLPNYQGLTEAEIRYIVDHIKNFINNKAKD